MPEKCGGLDLTNDTPKDNQKYGFFAFINRMKYIQRWGLMRNSLTENLSEHCFQTACIAHMLVLIDVRIFGGKLSPDRAAVYAMYHDSAEIITGDLPTPVKYFDSNMRDTYRQIEVLAEKKLVSMLPDEFKDDFSSIISYEEEDRQYMPFVKAADKISAHLKCIEELNTGNIEFKEAGAATGEALKKMAENMPSVKYFMEKFVPAFELSLDDLKN